MKARQACLATPSLMINQRPPGRGQPGCGPEGHWVEIPRTDVETCSSQVLGAVLPLAAQTH